MIIGAAMSLVILTAGAEPATDRNVFEEARARGYPSGLSVGMEEPIVSMVNSYTDCLQKKARRVVVNDFSEIADQAEKDIKRCTEVRKKAIAESDLALSKYQGWESQEKRMASINDTFDMTDASHIKLAKETAEWMEKHHAQN